MPTLNWIGKDAVTTHHKHVPIRLLEPVPGLSFGDITEGNLIVEGDNLDALKALLPRYIGQVKCIYIDPPYNTGNEGWKYNDNVNSPEIRRWLGQVVGKEGDTLDRHDRWLCMMYPRLVLLRQFLKDEGVIFISIDDASSHLLKTLCDEIFGARNFIATLVWNTEGNTDNQFEIKVNHEYVLMYVVLDAPCEAAILQKRHFGKLGQGLSLRRVLSPLWNRGQVPGCKECEEGADSSWLLQDSHWQGMRQCHLRLNS